MKKLFFCFASLCLCVSVFAVSVNPSLDGRVIVAEKNVFPSGGFYGKAPGYLPGDTVVVTNYLNDLSVEVLILGTQDASEGVAILLSPEAAEKLQIEKNKDVYVNVQKKQNSPLEKSLSTVNNAENSSNTQDPDKSSLVLPADTEEKIVAKSRKRKAKTDEVSPIVDETPAEETVSVEEVQPEEVPVEEPELAEVQIEEVPVTEVSEIPAEKALVEEPELAEVQPEETIVEEIPSEKVEEVVTEEVPAEEEIELAQAPQENTDSSVIEITPDESEISAEVTEEAITEAPSEEIAAIEEEESSEEIQVENSEQPLEIQEAVAEAKDTDVIGYENLDSVQLSDVEESKLSDEDVIVYLEETEPVYPEEIELENGSPKDIFNQLMGEETETSIENEPEVVFEEIPEDSVIPNEEFANEDENLGLDLEQVGTLETESENAEVPETSTEEVVAEVEVIAESPIVESEKSSFEAKTENLVYEKFSNLPLVKQEKSKTYYIQISTMADKANIENVLALYAKKYPIKLVETKNSSYQVLVGPLNDDEYELVLARFKTNFADAFIRTR